MTIKDFVRTRSAAHRAAFVGKTIFSVSFPCDCGTVCRATILLFRAVSRNIYANMFILLFCCFKPILRTEIWQSFTQKSVRNRFLCSSLNLHGRESMSRRISSYHLFENLKDALAAQDDGGEDGKIVVTV